MKSGQTPAHFTIIRSLAKGGAGEVRLAEDTKLKRQVAIKVLPEAVRQDPDRLKRFRREAEVAANLNHPNIATIDTFFATFIPLPAGRCLSPHPPAGPYSPRSKTRQHHGDTGWQDGVVLRS